jgi:hypothetical protein
MHYNLQITVSHVHKLPMREDLVYFTEETGRPGHCMKQHASLTHRCAQRRALLFAKAN